MASLLFVRIIIYTFFRGFGISFWIFPEMMDDKYTPIYSLKVHKSLNVLEVIIRVLLSCFVGYVCFRFYQEPETFGKVIIKSFNFKR